MTIRKRVKNKWHFTLGDFDFKKATYNPDGSKSFEVWYKGDFIGECKVSHWYGSHTPNKKNESINLNIIPKGDGIIKNILGNIVCSGNKNGFPTKIINVTLLPKSLNMAVERKVILEKTESVKFVSPGVFTIERD